MDVRTMPKSLLSRARLGFVLGLGLLAAGFTESRAAAIPADGTVTPSGNDFAWTYPLPVSNTDRVQTGDFFVLYDFQGFNGIHSEPDGWTFSSPNVGPVPAGVQPVDDPKLTNLVWTRTGDPLSQGSDVGQFLAGSTFGSGGLAYFTAQATVGSGSTAGTKITSVGLVSVPGPGSDAHPAPEPGTLTMGILLALGGYTWHRRRRLA